MKKILKSALYVLVATVVLTTFFLSNPQLDKNQVVSSALSHSQSMAQKPVNGPKLAKQEEQPPAPDSVAWIRFAGTEIDNPVMQSADNDFYLRRDEYGKDSQWGCYFLDFECGPDSANYIIYGHSTGDSADGPRFSQLKRLNSSEFAAVNNTIEITVNDEKRTYQVFSSGLARDMLDNVAITSNPDTETLQTIIDVAIERSLYNYGVTATPKDKLLTLSTCTSDESARYLVVAKRVT